MSEEKLIRKQVYLSYKGAVSKLIYVFLKIRTTILPLDVFDKEIPSKGVIIEVGSGHGVVSKYLALSSPFRRLYAYDPDRIRTEIAKNTSTGIDNLCFYSERFSRSPYENVSGVIIIGVL